MFHTPNEAIVAGLRTSEVLFRRFTADLKPTEWHYQPVPGMNTVAWIVGHLVLIEHRRATALGATGLPELPDGFVERYGPTRTSAEPQTGLDSAGHLTQLFHAVRGRFVVAVRAASPAIMAEPLPTPHPLFADQGEAAAFMGQHAALHLGQITVLRRLLGYPPVT